MKAAANQNNSTMVSRKKVIPKRVCVRACVRARGRKQLVRVLGRKKEKELRRKVCFFESGERKKDVSF